MVQAVERFLESAVSRGLAPSPQLIQALSLPLSYSPFLQRVAVAQPEAVQELFDSGLEGARSSAWYREQLAGWSRFPEPGVGDLVRRFRNRELFRIACRDILSIASTEDLLRELSDLAEAILRFEVERIGRRLQERYGRPMEQGGGVARFVVLGLGKLGGRELNFSSDIDLIFAYSGQGRTHGGTLSISNGEFFHRLVREVVRSLTQRRPDGFLYRVDTRLRPFGEGGPLVLTFDAMDEYYQLYGRGWERYALIKGRPVAGDLEAGRELMERLRPFVYRRYLDYSAMEALREMKGLVEQEVLRRGMENNLKLGPGGIREIEFMVQAVQLIHGGRHPEIATPSLLEALEGIEILALMPSHACETLRNAYLFLRRLENLIQAKEERQEHRLPQGKEELALLARIVGSGGGPELLRQVEETRGAVSSLFSSFLGREKRKESRIPMADPSSPELLQRLAELGYGDPRRTVSLIKGVLESGVARAMSEGSFSYLRRVVAQAVRLVPSKAQGQSPEELLLRIVEILEAIGRRSSYLALLAEEPRALENLVERCTMGRWVSRFVSRYPVVIDDLVGDADPVLLRGGYLEMARERARGADDTESLLEKLAGLKLTVTFALALAHLSGGIHAGVVGERLSELAEALLTLLLEEAAAFFQKRDGHDRRRGLGVIGYGRLGSRELGFGSDLDLVFLYDSADWKTAPTRLCQRLIHLLTVPTSQGPLYQVDMRLRPDGQGGVLVSSAKGFKEYQLRSAWIWEHQALIRARPVAGDARVCESFMEMRREILLQPRDPVEVGQQVCTMRRRLQVQGHEDGRFFIKRGCGGMLDIEFLVQYLVLVNAADHPGLVEEHSTLGLLTLLEGEGIIGAAMASRLRDAYLFYMALANRAGLEGRGAVVEPGKRGIEEEVEAVRRSVLEAWNSFMDMEECCRDGDVL